MQRNIGQLTWTEVEALDLAKDGALVLPIGSIEQHGPHLSTDCDLVFADRFLDLALERLDQQTKVWRLPILPISKSNEHVGFAGTWYLSAETLMATLRDIAKCAVNNGFRRLVLWNCHGGNRALLEVAARDLRIETGLMTFQVFASGVMPDPLDPLDAREPVYGIHAGEWETSVMLALAPDRVRLDQRNCEFPKFSSETLALELTSATVGWTSRDFQVSGTWGDAAAATTERGQQRLTPLIDRLAAILTEIAGFEMGA